MVRKYVVKVLKAVNAEDEAASLGKTSYFTRSELRYDLRSILGCSMLSPGRYMSPKSKPILIGVLGTCLTSLPSYADSEVRGA